MCVCVCVCVCEQRSREESNPLAQEIKRPRRTEEPSAAPVTSRAALDSDPEIDFNLDDEDNQGDEDELVTPMNVQASSPQSEQDCVQDNDAQPFRGISVVLNGVPSDKAQELQQKIESLGGRYDMHTTR
jgi:hypothetical protein